MIIIDQNVQVLTLFLLLLIRCKCFFILKIWCSTNCYSYLIIAEICILLQLQCRTLYCIYWGRWHFTLPDRFSWNRSLFNKFLFSNWFFTLDLVVYNQSVCFFQKIGDGNFSCVFKVLKRIDGCLYAVKRSTTQLHNDTQRFNLIPYFLVACRYLLLCFFSLLMH